MVLGIPGGIGEFEYNYGNAPPGVNLKNSRSKTEGYSTSMNVKSSYTKGSGLGSIYSALVVLCVSL